uniref:Uncharacterized protein n=2 Tax=Oryza sativa subsp. japonica TaxID=39947 RepID=Q851T9_ORYSJ|nr:hypothetical protein [Oryza sativa Japonica Group]
MAPRKPNPVQAVGPDPGRVDDNTSFLGVSLMDDEELAKLVSSGALVEGQAFAPGKAVVELPQLSPSALVLISVFDWACRTSGFEPSATLFGAIFFAAVNSKTLVTPAGTKKTVFGSVNFNATGEAVGGRAETPGYTPTPSPGHNETGVESNSSPLRQKDLEGAKALVAFSSGTAAKGGPVKKVAKKKGLIDVARVFSDDESSDGTPTSPAGRILDLSAAPVPPLGAARAGGSTAAEASASAERIVTAAAKVFGSPPRQPVASPLIDAKGKRAVVETSASKYSLSLPRFAPGDFETRADPLPFVEGVSNLVLPASAPSLFTELNEFDEGCSAIKSLAVRILAAHCSMERTVRARLDGFKSRLRVKDDELGRKNLEMEALANTLKEVKVENKRLQSELEKGKEARAEVDRLKADLEKEKAHSAMLIDYYNLTEPKMEALRQEVHKAEASAAEESRRFSREMVKTTESGRTACQTLRLTLTNMGAKVRGVPSEGASAFDFSEWTRQAGGSISDCATAYGDCCARVSAAFTMGLLQQFGYEHIAEFPKYAKEDWEISAQDISPALRAWRKQFWQKDGRSTAKARLLEQLAKAEAADLCEEEGAAAGGGGGDAQDHPEV